MFNFDKFKELCIRQGVKISYIESRLGLYHGYFNNVRAGKNTIPENRVSMVAEMLNTTPEFLTDQTDDPAPKVRDPNYIEMRLNSLSENLNSLNTLSDSGGPRLRVLGEVAGGQPIEMIDNFDNHEISDWRDFDSSLVQYGSTYFVLRIKGDSMEPKIADGSMILVRQQDTIEDGQIAIVAVNNTATCKKVVRTPEGVILMPLNPKHPPQFYSNSDIDNLPVRILGRVMKAINDL